MIFQIEKAFLSFLILTNFYLNSFGIRRHEFHRFQKVLWLYRLLTYILWPRTGQPVLVNILSAFERNSCIL